MSVKNDLTSNDQHYWTRKTGWLDFASRAKRKKLPSQIVVIDWMSSSAAFSVYKSSAGKLSRHNEFTIDWSDRESKSPEDIGGLIRAEFTRRRISIQSALVSIPRRSVVLKNLTLPTMPANEQCDAVQLQCESLFPVPPESLVIDYVVSPIHVGENLQAIVVAAAPRDLISTIAEALHNAALKNIRIGFAEHGYPRLSQSDELKKWQIDVIVAPTGSDFVFSFQRFPFLTYVGRTPDSNSEKLPYFCSTINRLCHAATERHPELIHPIVNFFGVVDRSLESALAEQLPHNIRFQQWIDFENGRELALIASFEDQEYSLDFCTPRKSIDRQALGRRKTVTIALLIMLCCVSLGLYPYWRLQTLERELVAAVGEKASLESQLERLKPLEITWKKLIEFDRSKSDVAVELRDLLHKLKQSEKMFIVLVDVDSPSGSNSSTMRLKGKVKDRETFAELTDELLLSSDRYRLRPPLLEPITGDQQYAFSFTFEMEVKS